MTTSLSARPDLHAAIDQIVLATDLGPASAAATDEAFRLAGALQARLLAVTVIDLRVLQLPGGRYRSRVDQERARLEIAASALVLRGRRDRVPTSFLIWEGDPAESIVEAARSEGADVIVVGSHGRGAIGRALIGSVSDQVVRHAPCPVLVVRSARDRAEVRLPTDRPPQTAPDATALLQVDHPSAPKGP